MRRVRDRASLVAHGRHQALLLTDISALGTSGAMVGIRRVLATLGSNPRNRRAPVVRVVRDAVTGGLCFPRGNPRVCTGIGHPFAGEPTADRCAACRVDAFGCGATRHAGTS